MLVKQGIIPAEDGAAIADGLRRVRGELRAGRFSFRRALEAINMIVEFLLVELRGAAAARLHPTPSRNEQVAPGLHLIVHVDVGADYAQTEQNLRQGTIV